MARTEYTCIDCGETFVRYVNQRKRCHACSKARHLEQIRKSNKRISDKRKGKVAPEESTTAKNKSCAYCSERPVEGEYCSEPYNCREMSKSYRKFLAKNGGFCHAVFGEGGDVMQPYYTDDYCTIYHGDCREVLPTLPKVDLLLTDVPYMEVNRESSGLRSFDKGGADRCEFNPIHAVVSAKAQTYYAWCGIEQVSEMRAAMVGDGLSTRLIIWEKSNPAPTNGEHIWLSGIECCVFGRMTKATFNAKCRNTVLRGPTADANGHPTPKPQWLFSDLIQVSSNSGDTIIDPFMGSGTTLRAAKDLQRKAIGIEIEERYCEIAARRLQQEVLPL